MSENKNIINEQEQKDDHLIEGRNAVLEAFRAGKTIDKLYIQEGCFIDDAAVITDYDVTDVEHIF